MIEQLLQARGIKAVKVAGTHGGEYASPCPACGGRDRFRMWPEQGEGGTWYCRNCDKGGDSIEFLRFFDGLSFGEACKKLGLERRTGPRPILPTRVKAQAFTPADKSRVPESAWSEKAGQLLAHAERQLMASQEQLAQLARRGLPRAAAESFRLGWLPGEKGRDCYFRDRSAWGLPGVPGDKGKPRPLWIPAGLVVPALDDNGRVIRLRVRRPDESRKAFSPDMKYAVITGSSMRPLLLRPQSRAFVVVEAELDAMACAYAAESAGLDVGALAVGTNLGKPDKAAHEALSGALTILVALDFDQPDDKGERPGAKGYAFWEQTYRRARRWPVPRGKDPGEAFALGVDLALWISSGLPPVFHLGAAQGHVVASPKPPVPCGAQDALTVPFGQQQKEPRPEGRKIESCAPERPTETPQTPADDAPQSARPIAHAEAVAPAPAYPVGRYRGLRYTGSRLSIPDGPQDCLGVLGKAGLTAIPIKREGRRDYVLQGHERWDASGHVDIMGWLKTYGDWVYEALYGVAQDE